MAVERGRIRSLGGQPNWKQVLLKEAKKMSEFIVSAVMVVEGFNRCLLRGKHANLCLKVLFINAFIFFFMARGEKPTETMTTVCGLK